MRTVLRFGRALHWTRTARQLTQEDFSDVSSRTYISSIERNVRNPTLDKIGTLAKRLQVHPLTLVTLAYSELGEVPDALLERVGKEVRTLIAEFAAASGEQ